jgi:hypothetical protein
MNTKERVVIVICALWLIFLSLQNPNWAPKYRQQDFVQFGVIPVVVTLGYLWISRSRKKKQGNNAPEKPTEE